MAATRLRSLLELITALFSRLLTRKKPPEERMRERARNLYARHAPRIKTILGATDIPQIRIEISRSLTGTPAATSGPLVTLSYQYFSEKEDDGALVHEYAHAIHRCPRYDDETSWLIEGMADYVRDVLDFQTEWSHPHFEEGNALAGYQTTAHFLFWLARKTSDGISLLSKRLIENTYSKDSFNEIFGASLDQLVSEYERDQGEGSIG